MSVFVAIRPDGPAADHLAIALEGLRSGPEGAALRWQPPSQWHVTLAFVGEADEAAADRLAKRLRRLALAAVGEVRLRGAGCFGRQVLWVGVGDRDAYGRLATMAAAIPPRLRGLGLDVDRRPWRGHLTVARARDGDAGGAAAALADYCGPTWTATELLVVRSTGGPQPEHHVSHRIALS